jgi:hypothetical protein
MGHHRLRAAAGASPADPYFSSTSLLLLGNGTNGGQNNTFVDGSTNNFTITRNGNTTQGSFSPFSAPDGRWSNYFDGNGDYISAPASSAFAFGTGALTVEAWIYLTAYPSGYFCVATNRPYNSGNNNTWVVLVLSDGTVRFGDSLGGVALDSSTKLQLNRWYHIAACRASTSSNQTFVFINGTIEATGTATYDFSTTTNTLVCGWSNDSTAGNYLAGYVSNLRILKGTAQYTSAFTPSVSPLTAITNTSLLTCQSNRFIDNSTNAFTITPSGNAEVTSFSPFAPTAEYSASTNGGSGYFDGTGDYLTAADNAAFEFGSGDFTIEGWIYPLVGSTYRPIVAKSDRDSAGGEGSFILQISNTNKAQMLFSTGGTPWDIDSSGTTDVATNAWSHIAATRSGNTFRLFLNGNLEATVTSSITLSNNSEVLTVGILGYTSGTFVNPFNGFISSLRLLKGTAQYTSAFTPPTSPLTAITNTSLLLNFTNGSIIDSTGKNDLETVGDAQISTSVKKYGTGSLKFDGSGDKLYAPYTPINQFGSGNFTIEYWVYFNSVAADQRIVSGDANAGGTLNWCFYTTNSGTLNYYISFDGSNWTIAANLVGNVSTGQWYHVALVRNGSTFTPYLNGTSGTTGTNSSAIYATTTGITVGAINTGSYFNGYIDDLRITKGVARYTSAFTPPSAQLPAR